MSPRNWELRVWGILEAVNDILDFVKGMDYEEFLSDKKTLAAVSHLFMVIGEAARNIPEDLKNEHPSLPWQSMRATRNFITHEYWGVDPEILWTAIKEELPPLIAPLNEILKKAKIEPSSFSQ